MEQNLEAQVYGMQGRQLKHGGNNCTAYFLDRESIRYGYDAGGPNESSDPRTRILNPHSCLPGFKTYSERYGLVGRLAFYQGIRKKETMYTRPGRDVIPLYPSMFTVDWQGGDMVNELDGFSSHRYRKLMSKALLSQHRLIGYRNRWPGSSRYRVRKGRRY